MTQDDTPQDPPTRDEVVASDTTVIPHVSQGELAAARLYSIFFLIVVAIVSVAAFVLIGYLVWRYGVEFIHR